MNKFEEWWESIGKYIAPALEHNEVVRLIAERIASKAWENGRREGTIETLKESDKFYQKLKEDFEFMISQKGSEEDGT